MKETVTSGELSDAILECFSAYRVVDSITFFYVFPIKKSLKYPAFPFARINEKLINNKTMSTLANI